MNPRHAIGFLVVFVAAVAVRGDDDAFHEFLQRKSTELPSKFTFVRVKYASIGGYGEAFYDYDHRRWQRWETDYPEAEQNFLFRLDELTTLDPNPTPLAMDLTDERLGNYPFIYMSDVGWMRLDKEERTRLREHLERGGFLWVDDFWGQAEWDNLERAMREVFPEYQWREIEKSHPILNTPFKLDGCPMVPAEDFFVRGWEHDPPMIHRQPAEPVDEVHFRGLFDDDGRLLVVATHNTDIGDGWEREALDETYFERYSTKSYAIGVNIVVYALTH